jgi:hypothetical protein
MLDPSMLVVAFCGGILGTALGPLLAFTFTGFAVVFGEVLFLSGAHLDFTGSIAFGALLGPHVSFGGGAAALAYAAKMDYLQDRNFHYHPAKEVTVGLGSRWDTLVVGGVFGSAGYLIAVILQRLSFSIDPVAGGVVASAFLHRLIFGYTVLGLPFLNDEDVRHETWLPYQNRWLDVSVLSVGMGVFGSYLTYLTTSPFIGFGLSTAFLVFLCSGVDNIPVTHHMSLPAGTALLAYVGTKASAITIAELQGMVTLEEVILVGGVFGLFGGLAGEVCQRLFYARSETHLDPPAASIVVSTALISLLSAMGLLAGTAWIPG